MQGLRVGHTHFTHGCRGLARAISPVFTRYDGDIIFSLSLGELPGTELLAGAAAAYVVQEAILNAVKNSITLKI